MTFEEHKQRHKHLHESLDELVADWMAQTDGTLDSPLSDLAGWSKMQSLIPTETQFAKIMHLPTIDRNGIERHQVGEYDVAPKDR